MIFFDIDDTLLDNTEAERDAAAKFFMRHRETLNSPKDEFIDRWRTTTEHFIQRYISGELSFQDQRRERLRQIFGENISLSNTEADSMFEAYLGFYEGSWQLLPDVKACLDELDGYRLGIISNGNAVQQRQKLTALGIIEKFSPIVISEEVGVSKPDPGIFQFACRKAGVAPSDCWHIGDNLTADAQGSISAGLRGVWLNRNGSESIVDIPAIRSLDQFIHLFHGRS